MDQRSRVIILVVAVLLTVYRLVRYLRVGLSNRPTAIPGSAGLVVEPTAAPDAASQPAATRVRAHLVALAFLVWAVGTFALFAALFAIPQIATWPVLPRMVAGVLGSVWLQRLSRALVLRLHQRSAPPPDGNNPIR
jgi:hypothetical protein